MIQQARSFNSQSLLREAEFSILVLDSDDKVEYFQRRIDEVVEKRHDPDITYTGAKDLKRELLALLHQYGEVQTANVWCRGIIVDLEHIEELRVLIAQRLAAENIYGVTEIHLQDREINSPHIQFVGINAQRAEEIIAEIVVELNYERSMQSAIGRKYTPRYEIEPSAKIESLSEELESEKRQETIAQIESQDVEFFDEMRIMHDDFMKIINETKLDVQKIETVDTKHERMLYEKSTDELIQELDEKIKRIRKR